MARRRVATTWNPSEEPEIEAYLIAHSDNISAALRNALRVGVKSINGNKTLPERIVQFQDIVMEQFASLSTKLDSFSGVPVKSEAQEQFDKDDTSELGLEQLPNSIINNLKGLAKN